MIPILYEYNETAFTSDGIARLVDCISCIVTEGRNEIYECEFQYPVSGAHFDDIQEGRIIAVTHDNKGDIQPFDIYKSDKSIDGVVTFYAHHISYRLNEITVKPFTAADCSAAIGAIGTNSLGGVNPFTFWTDKSVSKTYTLLTPNTARSILGGEENSLLDVYGTGEYEFDVWDVNLWANRGQASGVEIRYGKNLTEYDNETDYSNVINGVVPYWAGTKTDGSPDIIAATSPVYSGNILYNHRDVVVPLDLSGEFETKPTLAELQTAAANYLAANSVQLPEQSIEISFVELWQTEEYKEFAPLLTLQLCDTVTVTYPQYGFISVSAKVVEVVFNVLVDRYDSITLGSIPTTLGAAITARTTEQIRNLGTQIDGIRNIAGDTLQYFWHTSTGGDTGAHITEVTKETFEADPSNGGPNLLARSNGVAIRNGLDELAQFGSTVTIGQVGQTRTEIDYHSMKLVDRDNASIFEVIDKRLQSGYAPYTNSYTVADAKPVGDPDSPSGYYYDLSYEPISGSLEVIADDVETSNYTYMNPEDDPGWIGYSVMFTVADAPTSTLVVNYLMEDDKAKALTFGSRKTGSFVGRMSVAMGDNNEASGNYSIALGYNNTSSATNSAVIGRNSVARANQATAVGLNNYATLPQEFVCGRYAKLSTTSGEDNLFVVGNGTGTGSNRSNAFTVDADGQATCESLTARGGASISNGLNCAGDLTLGGDILSNTYVDNPTANSNIGARNGGNIAIYLTARTDGSIALVDYRSGAIKWIIYSPSGGSDIYIGGNASTGINMNPSQTANRVLASPNGSDGKPTWRALVSADIPNLGAGKITSGTLGVARLPEMFQIKSYSYERTTSLSAGAGLNISGTNLGVSTPSNYKPIGVVFFATSTKDVVIRWVRANVTGSNYVMGVTNVSGSAVASFTAYIDILYAYTGTLA